MRLLLDTHIWIWSLVEQSKLGRTTRKVLADSASELWLSPVSTWELTMLANKGRIQLDQEIEEWVANAFEVSPLLEAPFTHEVVLETTRFDLPHRDPADRFLVATARLLSLTLVTADQRLIDSKVIPVLKNN